MSDSLWIVTLVGFVIGYAAMVLLLIKYRETWWNTIGKLPAFVDFAIFTLVNCVSGTLVSYAVYSIFK